MKFTYYSKKKAIDDKCFFTIRIDNDDELFRLNAIIVSKKYEMYTLTDCNFELGVFDDSITNIQSARKLYNQIKQEAMNLKENELVQRYYFTDDDGEEVFECFATEEDAYNKAKELANEYNCTIYVNTVIGEDIVDSADPDDEPETEETTPEVSAPVENTEHSNIVRVEIRAYDFDEKLHSSTVSAFVTYESGITHTFHRKSFFSNGQVSRECLPDSVISFMDSSYRSFSDTVNGVQIVIYEISELYKIEQTEDVPETASADEPETEDTTPAVSEVKQCRYCPECIYYKKCTSNAPENMKCKSKDGS